MKLYVCWGTFPTPLHEHVCHTAHAALKAAGHAPEVVHAHSFGGLPSAIQTPTRKKVAANTGRYWVPALELDDGSWIGGTKKVVAWAQANPAAAAAAGA
ncbi:MAG: hypothetical protein JWO02_2206 [Solirubrobacterales bacterium]|nr:hypothetical protein [Solirubrobacterales bacterium]